MLTLLIILAVYTVGSAIIRWANKPPRAADNPGKSVREISSVFDLIFPRLS